MTSYSRRKFLEALALTSAYSVGIWPIVGNADPQATQSTPASGAPLYLIIQGPWLLSVELGGLRVLTSEPPSGVHGYSYLYPRGVSSGLPYIVGAGDILHFSIGRPVSAPLPPTSKSLLAGILGNNQGLFFNSKVNLKRNLPGPNVRQVLLDFPDQILTAGLISNVAFALNGATLNSQVSTWPAALVFIYANWNSAVLTNSLNQTLDSVTPAANISYRKFQILRTATMGADFCQNATDDANHAVGYFSSLMDQLDFHGISRPEPTFPPCTNPVTIALGGDSNVNCTDLDSAAPWCKPVLKAMGPTLVNCASGGGGIVGCC